MNGANPSPKMPDVEFTGGAGVNNDAMNWLLKFTENTPGVSMW
jgi:hypothetical protein